MKRGEESEKEKNRSSGVKERKVKGKFVHDEM